MTSKLSPQTLSSDYGPYGAFCSRTSDHLRAAIAALDGSAVMRAALGDKVVDHYVHCGRWEQAEYDRRVTDWELIRNFERA